MTRRITKAEAMAFRERLLFVEAGAPEQQAAVQAYRKNLETPQLASNVEKLLPKPVKKKAKRRRKK